jgi:hypothetical protein
VSLLATLMCTMGVDAGLAHATIIDHAEVVGRMLVDFVRQTLSSGPPIVH